jgi:HEAT repeat protein
MGLAAAAGVLSGAVATADDKPAVQEPVVDKAAVDGAFEALKTYDWGAEYQPLKPIDDAIVATQDNAAARLELENRLAALLKTGASRDANDYVCRKLTVIGTTASVATLTGLLAVKENSHMARYALERIPAPEAAQALRDALPKLGGALKVGAIGSLGARRDAASVSVLVGSLKDADPAIAVAAACALGDIGNTEAAKALSGFAKTASDAVKPAIVDALFVAAEQLLAVGKKAEAMLIYKSLAGDDQPKHVRLAATRGRLVATGKKN